MTKQEYLKMLIELKDLISNSSRRYTLERIDEAIEKLKAKTPAPSVEWYTPPRFVELAREVMGAIDLDPASCARAQETVKAECFFTKKDSGLGQLWSGRVFCNPPYGKQTEKFLRKGLDEYAAGRVTQAIFLVNRTGAGWCVDLLDGFDAVCQVRKRIAFIDESGVVSKSPRYYNDFLYLGANPDKFVETFSGVGRCSVLN